MTLQEALEKLKSENCPAGLRLYLGFNDIGNEGAKALGEALNLGRCPSGLSLGLCYNRIGNTGALALADALTSGIFPSGLELNLSGNKIGDKGVQAFTEALKSGKYPSGLELGLGRNNIGQEGAHALAEAIMSGNCPSGLELDLRWNEIGNKGAQALAEAFNSGHCRFGTTIRLDNEKYNFVELSEKNNESIHQAALGIAILIGGFSQRNEHSTSRLLPMFPEVIVNYIIGFLPGHISAIKIAAYLKKSFIRLMETNSEYSQKHRSNNSVNQHLYDKQYGLSLWKCNEDRRKNWLKNHPIMIQRQMPIHSFK